MKKEIKDSINEIKKEVKTFGIITGIVMILIGICAFITPLATSAVFIWLLVVGILVDGISAIVTYFKSSEDQKDGLSFALGIFWVIVSLILIADGLSFDLGTTIALQKVAAFFIGFVIIFQGISSICSKNIFYSKATRIFTGILEIIAGILVLSAPLMGLFTLTVVFGIFLIIGGIAIFARALSIKQIK